jgi:hypothetical protein
VYERIAVFVDHGLEQVYQLETIPFCEPSGHSPINDAQFNIVGNEQVTGVWIGMEKTIF